MTQDKKRKYPDKNDVKMRTPDSGVRMMMERMEELGVETVFDRFDAQKPLCGFGINGTCCKNCHMGPCRITKKSPKGVCGADANVIAARNILRWVAAGVAAHGARGREVMLTLKAVSDGRLDLPILGEDKVLSSAKAFGIDTSNRKIEDLAGEIAMILLDDLCRTFPGEHRTLRVLAPEDSLKTWKNLGILPIGAYHEVFESLHRTTTGTDGDWRNLMYQMLRCGLAFAWTSVAGTSIAMDCLYGPPKRSKVEVNLGSITEDTVNIAVHGHSPVLVSAIVKASRRGDLTEKARENGARKIQLYGVCCSGHSALAKFKDVKPLSSAIGAEMVLATGAMDLWVADVQDVFPGIMDVAACFNTKVITTSDSARLPGAEHLAFDHYHSNLHEADKIAERIISYAIDNFGERLDGKVYIPPARMEAEVGFSVENIASEFGSIDILSEYLKTGQIKGIVNLVGCNNPKIVYEEAVTVLAEKLIKNDVLVLTNGCAAYALLKMGYCNTEGLKWAGNGLRSILEPVGLPPVWHMGECLDNARASALFRLVADSLGESVKNLPFAFSSPEWSNEKGVGAALGFRLIGVNSYHCVEPPISGSEKVSNFFYNETRESLGSVMVVEKDPVVLAECILGDIDYRRNKLSWKFQ